MDEQVPEKGMNSEGPGLERDGAIGGIAVGTAVVSALCLCTSGYLFTDPAARTALVGRGAAVDTLPFWAGLLVQDDLYGTSPLLWLLHYRAGDIWWVYGAIGLICAVCAYGLWYREELTRTLVLTALYSSFCYSATLLLLVAFPPHRVQYSLVVALPFYGFLLRELTKKRVQEAFGGKRRFLHPLLVVSVPVVTLVLTAAALVIEGLKGLR